MRIATWNVNSVRARIERVIGFAEKQGIDVLLMQEIKCKPAQFPYQAFEDAGYTVEAHGLNQWNGVAIASRLPVDDIEYSFPGMPGFQKGYDGDDAPLEARAISALIEGVRLWSLYVPNGRGLDDPHYVYKLAFLDALRQYAAHTLERTPDLPLALTGDFNIAPTPEDVGDPSIIEGVTTHVSPEERAAFTAFEAAGLIDVVRPLVPTGYTFWDYKQLRFPRNEGLRIDFILGSPAFADLVEGASIERDERKGEGPSDHVPVVVDLNLSDDDDDDMPMIFG
ncbi:exodeoxyribonuclease III [Microbacterium amylolyticum]|uniref:Exodeoxyribonuclease-3 n=1 Tax=Microbacterium amylolyticum TaxID=936337 RepID=A0ABS4ZJW2_9MICO|nr:exodeoxyribonuclease III [Microbacterium amylolyticum]MBP2436756.1 exodeoxyribonuclease-3 [Microbacterium amylolyticum]